MEIQLTNAPTTPRFDNPRLSESPGLPATSPQTTGCIPRPEPPRAPGLLDYSLGLLTGAALVLLIHALHSDDTANHANQED